MTHAFIFPGQGSQKIGMGKDLYDTFPVAKEVFQQVDEALGQDLSKLMFEGSDADLTLTANTQPALMAVSMAVIRVLEKEAGFNIEDKCAFVAGHSLGEYSALCAAEAFDITTCAKLLRIRGEAMQEAVPVGQGTMAALLGVDFQMAEDIAAQAQVDAGNADQLCVAANDNAPGQVVISGTTGAVEIACTLAKDKGAKRAVVLPVSAPFHSPLMRRAADRMAQALADVNIQKPRVKLIANVTAQPTSDPHEIRRLLVEQVTGMVRWRESVETMAALGVDSITEVGSGKVLSGLVKRINGDITTANVETAAQIKAMCS